MKPALKIEVSRDGGIALVTTEDGVFGLPIEAVDDPIGMLALTLDDYTNTPYNYFPEFLMDEVRAMGSWKTIYTLKSAPEGATLH